jgi:hypothetical protein
MTGESLDIPFTRRHVRTGQPRGGRPGNQNAFKHGRRSAAFVACRKAFMQLLRMAREAAEMARRS